MNAAHAAAPAAPMAPSQAAAARGLGGVRGVVTGDDGEVVILNLKPGRAFILLHRIGPLCVLGVLGLAGIYAAVVAQWLPLTGLQMLFIAVAAMLVLLVWERLEWQCRAYVLTDRRVIWVSGVVRQLTVEAPLSSIQHTVLYRSLRERIAGLGTIGLATAGTDAVEIVWHMVDRPDEVLAVVRQTIQKYAGHPGAPAVAPSSPHPTSDTRPPTSKIPVIGLAGGIGAGKSTVAKLLEKLGCVVIDSDARARAALDQPEVRGELVSWWGRDILASDGKVDRSKVAAIVFADPAQRKRLEALVHPLVRARRADLMRDAAASANPPIGFVIDAPLLFEAGLDKECDAVIFVDAPRDQRLRRVASERGWDEAELNRRESAQMPLQSKRELSDYCISNADDPRAMEAQVGTILDQVRRRIGEPDSQ